MELVEMGGTTFLMSDYANGATLHELVREIRQQKLLLSEVLAITKELAKALSEFEALELNLSDLRSSKVRLHFPELD